MKKVLILCLIFLVAGCDKEIRNGIENFDKNYYINTYGTSLNSNLSIFPDNKSFKSATFSSSFENGLFDSYGRIILDAKYDLENFHNEIDRLSKINITISETCYSNSNKYTNYIKFDDTSYPYKAYVAIDGFANTYEYALINEFDFEIIYLYLAYPDANNNEYNKYLKNDEKEYSRMNTLDLYSIYNHSFDGNKSFMEFDDCL